MPGHRVKRNMAPFIVSASDLAFIMLFFFMIVGNGATEIERIEMPYKVSSQDGEESTAPFRIEIYDQNAQSDSSRMVLINTRTAPPDSHFVMIDNRLLADRSATGLIHERIDAFISQSGISPDSVRVDVFSAAHSYYGLVALAMASCYKSQYPCNLVYRAEVE